jgi:hypothetical protein
MSFNKKKILHNFATPQGVCSKELDFWLVALVGQRTREALWNGRVLVFFSGARHELDQPIVSLYPLRCGLATPRFRPAFIEALDDAHRLGRCMRLFVSIV